MDENELYCVMTWAWKNEGEDEKADALCHLYAELEQLKQQLRDAGL